MSRFKPNLSLAGIPCEDRSIGFLEYGSSDDSVILQHPFTSLPTAAELDVATVTEVDSAITFDANGMLLGSNRLRIATLSNSDATARALLSTQGQISFQVEKEAMCNDGTQDGTNPNGATSTGDTYAGNFNFIQLRNSASNQELLLRRVATQDIEIIGTTTTSPNTRFFDSAITTTKPAISTVGKDDYVTVNIGWDGDFMYFGIDGFPISYAAWSGATDIGDFLDFNSRNTFGPANHIRYIKNVQVSTKKPCFPSVNGLTPIVLWGDSQVEGFESDRNTDQLDVDMGHTICRALYTDSDFPSNAEVIAVDNGGVTLANHSTGALSTDAGNSYTNDIVGNAPRVVVWSWGTNDALLDTSFSEANFTTALQSNVDDIMALSSVEQLILLNVASFIGNSVQYTAQNNANRVIVNNLIEAEPARWQAANPGSSKSISVIDVFTLLGGDTTGNLYWIEETRGTDNLHHTDKAHYLKGTRVYEKIAAFYSFSRT